MDKHYESLVRLYLRLKGFLTSNLIIHSDQPGYSKSELDVIAIRMPFHLQDYRWVNVKDQLELSDSRIEILIADVKNYKNRKQVKFNQSLRCYQYSIKQLIEWIGIYDRVSQEHIDKFEKNLNLHRLEDLNGFAEFEEDTPAGKFKIKFTFFCPSLSEWNGSGFKYIHGSEIIDYIWECLNENKEISTCSRRYGFDQWNELEDYVRFFKGKKAKVTKLEFEDYCLNQLK